MVFGKGIPVVSVLIWNQGQSKLYRIGDTMEEITIQADVDHLTQVYTGKLVGIELGPAQVRADKPGYMSYDNIPTDGYENPICAMVPNIDATHEVVKILIQTEDGSYIPLMMEEIDSIRLADNEWITSVKEALESYIDSADLSGINEISLDNDQNTIDISIFDKGILNLGFVDFLATVEGLVSATARINNQTYVMTIGSEETYDTFRQGLLDSIPTQSGETVKGDLTMANGDGTSLVYTLKVTYFNQADEFNKITDYLDGYSAEDATVVKSADKTYEVTTHVGDEEDLLFDIVPTITSIENLTDVKVTIGDQFTNSTDAATLKNYLNAALHFEVSWDPVVVTVEVTAGGENAAYTLTFASDYDITEVSAAILEPCFVDTDNDELTLVNDGADGITWTNATFKVDPHMLTDSTGFGAALKTVPHIESVSFNIAGQIVTIASPIDDAKLAQMKDHLVANAPATVDDAQNVVCSINLNFDNVNPNPEKFVSYGVFLFSSFDPEASVDGIGYATVAQAFAAASEGDTVTLNKSITVSNSAVNATPNNPVLVVPNGVIFDGADHTIAADADTWVGSNANHVVGVSNVTATIKNLNVVGHANTKSGIVCFGQTGNVTLENVDVKNCGNCGVQVAGATVSATGLTTSGNAWGGVNADMGSDGSTPALTIGDGCTFAENAEVYTEITDQDVITAAGMTKYQGYGETLKGFIY